MSNELTTQDKKLKFIELRANQKTYADISKELNISKSTCTNWNNELKQEIALLKREQLKELYNAYYMTKEARIKNLGTTLSKIDEAIKETDLSEVDPAKLLELKLKYSEALKDEYIEPNEPIIPINDISPETIMKCIAFIINEGRQGNITAERMHSEITALTTLLKAYETTELKYKLDIVEQLM